KVKHAEHMLVLLLTYTPPANIQQLLFQAPNLTATEALRVKEYEDYTTVQTRKYPSGEVKRRMTLAERVEEYRDKFAEYRDLSGPKRLVRGKDAEKAGLRQAKADLVTLRAGLVKVLDKQTDELIKELDKLLTKDQKAMGKLPPAPTPPVVRWIDWATRW